MDHMLSGSLIAHRYRLFEPLGRGGQGRVWRARDEVLNRDVAIKEVVAPPGLTERERLDAQQRGLREARAIARLDQNNVIRIYDVIHSEDELWIVMELIATRSLHALLLAEGPLPPHRVVRLGMDLLAALRAVHEAGVLHRDIKPANVLIRDDGTAVLVDFGLATMPGDADVTQTGYVLGSPGYLAPERALGTAAGPPADLWSLGATLYMAVEGRPPYDRPTAVATLAALATEPPQPPRQAGALGPVLDGLLRRDPTERISADIAGDMLQWAAGETPTAVGSSVPTVREGRPPQWTPPVSSASGSGSHESGTRMTVGRRRGLVAALLGLAVVLVGAVLMFRQSESVAEQLPVGLSSPSGTTVPVAIGSTGATDNASSSKNPAFPTAGSPAATTPATPTPRPNRSTVAPTSIPSSPTSTAGALPARAIVGNGSNRCIEVPGPTMVQFKQLHIWDCRVDSVGQWWTFPADGTVRAAGMCMDLAFGSNANGTKVWMAPCTGAASQKFVLNAASDLVNLSTDKCVDVSESGTANGSLLHLWTCLGISNQKFHSYPLS